MEQNNPKFLLAEKVPSRSSNGFAFPALFLASSLTFNASAATVSPSIKQREGRKAKMEISVSGTRYVDFSEIKNSWVNNIMSKLRKRAQVNHFPLPTDRVLEITQNLLFALKEKSLFPQFINPSSEGGVVVEYTHSEKYLIVEIINNGEIALLRRNNVSNQSEAFDLDENNLVGHALESI